MAVLSTVLGLVSGLVDVYIQRIDYTSTANINYVGLAAPGTSAGTAGWQIKRVTLDSSGRPTLVEFADGDTNFDNIWSNITTLSYK